MESSANKNKFIKNQIDHIMKNNPNNAMHRAKLIYNNTRN